MPDYNALKSELLADPAKLGYAGQTDSAVAALMNAQTQTITNPLIPLTQVGIWAAKTGVRGNLQANADNTASPVRAICLMVLDLLKGLNGPPLDVSNADNKAMMGALIQAGVMTQANADALVALGNSLTSRALLTPGWGVAVQTPDITRARSV